LRGEIIGFSIFHFSLAIVPAGLLLPAPVGGVSGFLV
jgi:hypothetical protein